MADRQIREVENYTRPFLVMAFVNLFNGFFMLWAFFGMAAVLPVAFVVHVAIQWLEQRRAGG